MRKIILLSAVLLLVGCQSWRKTVEVPVYVHDTTYVAKTYRDSVYVDRWHTVETKGDTVYVTQQQIVSKWRTITDTAYKVVEKPVTVTVEQIKEVAKPLTWWQRTHIYIGIGAVVLLVLWVLLRLVLPKKLPTKNDN